MQLKGIITFELVKSLFGDALSLHKNIDKGSGIMKKSLGAKALAALTPIWEVGTYGENGEPNIMTSGFVGIVCAAPPAIGVSLRKATATYHNILNRKAFTVSIPSQQFASEIDYFGIASGKVKDKFVATGLTPVKSDLIDAPYVKEFPFILECKLIHTLELGLHTQFIGEIVDIKVDEAVLDQDGIADVEKIKPIILDTFKNNYYGIGNSLGKAFTLGRTLNDPTTPKQERYE